ncbi:5224_t:CDS:2 [Ambispora gerdemannii]|uniref:5224_t:CDS:1 n=1 Tax=Ambispora gerdemannii TaxID=144530 RepID=A0A9N8Z1W9_9GLOM|nr:5224_t:CDS:2 [Ambispora gerdemannii]
MFQMVGLPARGKTYIAQKVCRYLQWLSVTTKVFNVGNYRRKLHGAHQEHTFFDPANKQGEIKRRECATEALNDMIRWFEVESGTVAIFDATNSTRARRTFILEACAKHDIQVMFIESVCQDENLVLQNIMEVKLSSPDYKDMDPEKAAEDFRARISHYENQYEPITEKDTTYIKLINVGSQVVLNLIQGYLQSRIVYYLMNLHILPRSIFFTRHGESMFNLMSKIGGDSELSPRGRQYAHELPKVIQNYLGDQKLTVWTSTMRRTIQTAESLPYPKLQWKALDELDAGVCDGMTYEEIEVLTTAAAAFLFWYIENNYCSLLRTIICPFIGLSLYAVFAYAAEYPEDYANRDDDKFNYRYRGGESYRDVVFRLEPVIMELERQQNILIVGHQAILRCIYGYFLNLPQDDLPYIKIPLHTVIKLTPKAYGCDEVRYKVDVDAVDTHRPKPLKLKNTNVNPINSIPATSVLSNAFASLDAPILKRKKLDV